MSSWGPERPRKIKQGFIRISLALLTAESADSDPVTGWHPVTLHQQAVAGIKPRPAADTWTMSVLLMQKMLKRKQEFFYTIYVFCCVFPIHQIVVTKLAISFVIICMLLPCRAFLLEPIN